MKPHSDHPDITAYALGEPHSFSAAEWAENHAEIGAVQDLALHLQATAAIPDAKLHPHQRSFILNPQTLLSSHYISKASRPKLIWSTVFKGGIAAALLAGSFIAGRQISQPVGSAANTTPVVQSTAVAAASAPVLVVSPAEPAVPEVVAQQTIVVAEQMASAETTSSQAGLAKVETKSPAVVPATPASQLKITASALLSTTEQAFEQSSLTMKELRLSTPRQRETAASPMRKGQKKPELEFKPEKSAELLLHSWSAQVFSCPWKPESRLVHVQLQLPSVQQRKDDGAFSISFDPNAVRYYRYLGRRSTPGVDSDSPAYVSLWYEVQTNGSLGTAEAPRLLGSLKAQDTRFTTAVKDTSLNITDAGQTQLKDQQCLETALLGFGLLMHGAEKSAQLQPGTLLQLAQRAQQMPDPNGELKRLIRTLRDAEQLTNTEY